MATHPTIKNQLMAGMYNCPRNLLGNSTKCLGQISKRMASLMSEKQPLINACEAMMVANVLMPMANQYKFSGTM